MIPEKKIQEYFAIAQRMISNEDDFGIFCQGFFTGIVVMCGQEIRTLNLEEIINKMQLAASNADFVLYDFYLAGKRHAEMQTTNASPQEKLVREQTVKMLFDECTKKRQENAEGSGD